MPHLLVQKQHRTQKAKLRLPNGWVWTEIIVFIFIYFKTFWQEMVVTVLRDQPKPPPPRLKSRILSKTMEYVIKMSILCADLCNAMAEWTPVFHDFPHSDIFGGPLVLIKIRKSFSARLWHNLGASQLAAKQRVGLVGSRGYTVSGKIKRRHRGAEKCDDVWSLLRECSRCLQLANNTKRSKKKKRKRNSVRCKKNPKQNKVKK